jgi:hypothetical protein
MRPHDESRDIPKYDINGYQDTMLTFIFFRLHLHFLKTQKLFTSKLLFHLSHKDVQIFQTFLDMTYIYTQELKYDFSTNFWAFFNIPVV